MRKYQHKQILELIRTLNEATAEIKRMLLHKELTSVVRLLADCQESAIQIGSAIDNTEGEGTQTVTLLEEYCDMLYQISTGTECADADSVKRLQKQLYKIESSLNSELKPNKIEMVFLPYNASMWDAFESVWLVAKDDPECDAYVVPIPYYDRLPGGAFGQMHDEGGRYPEYVPVVDWRAYNIEACHPDVIFIHNPYDDFNIVTSVHPDYYSKRLKGCTDLLCYSPYFISTMETGDHFITTPAVFNADKIFLQSEKIRNRYISVFKEYERISNCKNRFGEAEQKFIALGSPKCDKVINSKREDFILPDEWLKMLEKPDGTLKRTILYSTSIGAILQGGEQYLKKMRATLDWFRGRDDVVLWWRPHPLSEATIASMRPRFLAEYKRIVTDYKLAGSGIYDDTPDSNMAVIWTDAYYGDHSSLIASYFCTAKPVMIQTHFNYNTKALIPLNICECGNYIYFSVWGATSLMRLEKATGDVDAVVVGGLTGYPAYSAIVCLDGVLYLIPRCTPNILAYDTNANAHFEVGLSEDICKLNPRYNKNEKFVKAFKYKGRIFLVGSSYPAIVCYRPETGRLDHYTGQYKEFTNTGEIVLLDACVADTKIVVVGKSRRILFFDMESLAFEIKNVDTDAKGFMSVSYDGDNYWLSPINNAPIICWNPESGMVREFGKYPKGLKLCDYMFNASVFVGNYLWLFPSASNSIVKLNCNDGEMTVVKAFDFGECTYARFFAELSGDIIYTASYNSNGIDMYNVQTNDNTEIRISAETIRDLDLKIQGGELKTIHDTIQYEGGINGVMAFVNGAASNNDIARKNELVGQWISSADGSAGRSIYDYVKREILGW